MPEPIGPKALDNRPDIERERARDAEARPGVPNAQQLQAAAQLWNAKPVPRAGPPPVAGKLNPDLPRGQPPVRRPELSAFAAGRAKAQNDLRSFYNQVKGVEIHHENPFNNGAVASVAWADLPNGRKVVIRHVENPEGPVALNNGSYVLNEQLGRRALAFASAVSTGAKPLMLMAHAPEGFEAGNKAPAQWLAKVPEETRVICGLMDFLTVQQDRLAKNVLVNERGEVGLIDPDFSWDVLNPWSNNPSVFYPGGMLAPKGAHQSFKELPARAQEVVREISRSAPTALAQTYGVSLEAATELKERAQLVMDKGLSGAIAEIRAQTERSFGVADLRTRQGFARDGDVISARVGQSTPGHMLFGPYHRFPVGRLNVEFNLRLPGQATPQPNLDDAVRRNGGAPAIGRPLAWAPDVHRWGPGWVQDFEGGHLGPNIVMRRDGAAGAFVVRGSIRDTYFQEGGGPGRLGFPVEDEHESPTGAQRFERGHITWDFEKNKFRAFAEERPSSPVVATLDIYDNGRVLARRDVQANELTSGQWTSVFLHAGIKASHRNTELRVYWNGKANLDAGRSSTW